VTFVPVFFLLIGALQDRLAAKKGVSKGAHGA
jgi:hypothetical protein